MNKVVEVEKEVYDAILRNSIKVYDLDAENQKLKELLKKIKPQLDCLVFTLDTIKHKATYEQRKELSNASNESKKTIEEIENIIGEKK